MSTLQESIIAKTHDEAQKFIEELGEPIEVQVARCFDYSALLRGEHGDSVTFETLLTWARQDGRVIISGRGASGKSALLRRLALQICKLGHVPFLIDLSRWSQGASTEWIGAQANAHDAMNFLLKKFGISGHDVVDAEFLPPNTQKYFLVDGLNETPGTTADQIMSVCDRIASLLVGASVIVTDRLVRRTVEVEKRWCFAMPLPVRKAEVKRLITSKEVTVATGVETLLGSPFFLDRAMRGELKQSPLATIRSLLETRGHLSIPDLTIAVTAAYKAYETDKSRTFSRARFDELGGLKVAFALLESGILVPVDNDRVAFAHHWYHDYLASRYVVKRPHLWSAEQRHKTFDTLTFGGNSFDAIAFALELSKSTETGTFLRAVYDWSPYAAGYALAEADIGHNDVPEDVRLIILGMLAIRRFDRHALTVKRAEDALDLLRDPTAKRLRTAPQLADLLKVIQEKDLVSSDYGEWSKIFTLPEQANAPDELLKSLAKEDSVIGWTAANVLKRLKLTDAQLEVLCQASRKERAVVRWRAVHAMGGFAGKPFIVKAVLDRLDHDTDDNVRYGAIRSLVELASRDETALHHLADLMIKRADLITKNARIQTEFEWAIFLSKGCAPKCWGEEISRVIYALLEQSGSASEIDHWSRLASRLRLHHRADGKVVT